MADILSPLFYIATALAFVVFALTFTRARSFVQAAGGRFVGFGMLLSTVLIAAGVTILARQTGAKAQ